MEERLKQVLGRTDVYLDFHSVIDGFRRVGLIGLIEVPDEFNKQEGLRIPSFKEQVEFLRRYLDRKARDYVIKPAWSHLYFILSREKENEVERLLINFRRPIDSPGGQRELGKLLSYPECCVEAHYKGTLPRSTPRIIPFASCSEECGKPWREEYLRLSKKYGVNYSKQFFSNI